MDNPDVQPHSKPWFETLHNIFNDIKNRKKENKLEVINRLKQYVAEQTHEMKGEHFTHFMHDINEHIKELTKSTNFQDVLAGIVVLDKLLDVEYDLNDGLFISQWAAYLRNALHQSESTQVVSEAAKCLGRLVRIYQSREFIEFEIRQALEWLSSGNHFRVATAVAVLAELFQNVPTLISVEHVESFVELMSQSLQDSDLTVRQGVVDVLRWSLRLLRDRSLELRTNIHKKVYILAESGLKTAKSVDSVHGSLLIFGELLAENCEYLKGRFDEICSYVLSLREHKHFIIRRTVIILIPQLAKFNVSRFSEQHLAVVTEYLLNAVNSKKERGPSFLALGEMVVALKERIRPQLSAIMKVISSAFSVRSGRSLLCPELFQCVSLLAKALGSELAPFLKPILPQMFATQFSQLLIDTLAEVAKDIPSLREPIQERLLMILGIYLANKESVRLSLKPPPISPKDSGPLTPSSNGTLTSPISAADQTSMILLSLHTLSTFEFDFHLTSDLIHKVITVCLDNENPLIRKKAVVACTKLLLRKGETPTSKKATSSMILDVLDRLLKRCLTELDATIRESILQSLDERFDFYLAQSEFIKPISLLLYDEVFEIREIAVSLLGRLSARNPAYVFPTLRAYLLDILREIESSEDIHKKENSARLLGRVIRSLSRFVKPYTDTLVQKLYDIITQENSSRLSAYGLAALGNLSDVAGETMMNYMDKIMPLVIDNFQEQSSSTKRYVALNTLNQLIESTGYVIEPFIKYTKLLDTILNKIKREENSTTRAQLVRLLGTIGALDPYKYKVLQLEQLEDSDDNTNLPNKLTREKDLMRGILVASDDYYPALALTILRGFLRKPFGTLAPLQTMVIQATMTIFQSLGLKCVPYLKHFVPLFMHVMKVLGDSIPGLRELTFKQLCNLVRLIKHYTRDFLNEFFQMIKEYWDTPSLITPIIEFIEEMANALNDEIKDGLKWIIPKMLKILSNDPSPSNNATIRILHAFNVFGTLIDDYMPLIIPAIIRLIDPHVPHSEEIRKVALLTLGNFSQRHSLVKYATGVVLPIARLLESGSFLVQQQALDTLCDIAINYENEYKRFIPLIQIIMNKKQLQHQRYTEIVTKLLKDEPLTTENTVQRKKSIPQVDELSELNNSNISPKAEHINSQLISNAWDTTRCFTKSDWFEWFRKLSITLLSESPSSALRCMAPLASSHQPVARQLFNAAFVSCWVQLPPAFKDSLVKSIETALSAPNIPSEILHHLLDLAEFMEHNEKPLPIEIKLLASLSHKCQAYAKALHYKEIEFQTSPQNTIEDLIYINNALDQLEAAQGLVKYAQQYLNLDIKLSWYEKVQRWTAALEKYEELQKQNPNDLEVMIGRMRCMQFLSDWDGVARVAEQAWRMPQTISQKREVASLALLAAIHLMRWDVLETYVSALDENSMDSVFYRAIIAVHRDQYDIARTLIDRARDMAATELTALIGESYSRAYSVVVRSQQLAELEEVITYKCSTHDEEKRQLIKQLWRSRLDGVERNVEVWQSLLAVRSLVIAPREDPEIWIKFANLVRKNARPRKARKILQQLLVGAGKELKPDDPLPDTLPMVKYCYLKVLYANPDPQVRQAAYDEMERWTSSFSSSAEKTHANQSFTQIKSISLPALPLLTQAKAKTQFYQPIPTPLLPSINTQSRVHPAVVPPFPLTNQNNAKFAPLTTQRNDNFYNEHQQFGGRENYRDSKPTPLEAVRTKAAHNDFEDEDDKQEASLMNNETQQQNVANAFLLSSTEQASSAENIVEFDNDDLLSPKHSPPTKRSSSQSTSNENIYQARALAKFAQWKLARYDAHLEENVIHQLLTTSKLAIEKDGEWYKAWHIWAIVHYRAVSHYEKLPKEANKIDQHLLPAVTGFIRSVALAPYDNLQDTLRLLHLWFKYGAKKEIEKAVSEGFEMLNLDTWLAVIPQLMARIHIPVRSVRQGVHKLLSTVGTKHPQALVFPLIVASRSPYHNRVAAAQSIIANLRPHFPRLFDQTLLVANELVRVAVLWKEKWSKGIEEAFRLYFTNKNPEGMMQILQPLHALLEQGAAETAHEKNFVKAFGKDLERAWSACKDFIRTGKVASINLAWDLYSHVLRIIKKQLQTEFDKLHLSIVSPKLLEMRDLEVAVPGTYKAKGPLIRIRSFAPVLKVIPSKQQPRKIVIHGTNGVNYPFLLKAHEDLRQDERVMQLFGLVNTFLKVDDVTAKNHLDIRTFAVVPLSPDTGLIEWVPHCDTLHELLKDYRKAHNFPLETEPNYMQRICSTQDYYKLTVIQKMEVLQYALDRTPGNDLAKILWLNSHNSEEWLDKRTTYTRSLAVMSMVGYILGLGDRHPNNLLLNRNTGKVIHIDFGDCFEVAMYREKFAEKVPFRLTRMLVNAMEVSGIEGNFRTTCESVMKVLRENKESIMAVLEAFVYDPLINWRLITNPGSPEILGGQQEFGSGSSDDETFSPGRPTSISQSSAQQAGALIAQTETPELRDTLNQKALNVIERVSNKLTGRDFPRKILDVEKQVDLLIKQARSIENLCQSYLGWCPYW